MNETDRKFFEALLKEKYAGMKRDLGTLESNLMRVTSAESSGELIYSDHMSDLGSDAIEREKAFMFASRDGAYLEQLEAALQRIQAGSYGMCRECGCHIPRARLEAVPTTQVCVPCKEKQQERKSA
ncbi:MAG: TraR/DksA C4-type zinc finger protein [bacterium]|nr:TraR/DksA C4-type zinc finger protein [bacterium]